MANIASLFFSLIFPALTVGLLILKLVQFANLEALQRKSVLIPIIAGILQLLWLVFAGYFFAQQTKIQTIDTRLKLNTNTYRSFYGKNIFTFICPSRLFIQGNKLHASRNYSSY